jgi:hypothetical protein
MKELGEQWIDKDGNMQKCIWTDGNAYTTKDLGPVNEDGCLPSPWGGYPKIIHEDNLWCVEIHEPVLVCTDEYPTKQEAIDAWNRRAV